MKIEQITKYICEVCEARHDTAEGASKCESIPVKHDKGVKVGDKVRITAGDGIGLLCTVENVRVHSPGWGPSTHDHAVYLIGKVDGSWGHRQLSHNSYEVIQ
jgi:hypothetical protein